MNGMTVQQAIDYLKTMASKPSTIEAVHVVERATLAAQHADSREAALRYLDTVMHSDDEGMRRGAYNRVVLHIKGTPAYRDPSCEGSHDPTLAAVFAEMRRARALHGDGYMGNLAQIAPTRPSARMRLLGLLSELETEARWQCQNDPNRASVLAEEVAEALIDAIGGKDPRTELVQVAAMVLAWLGVEPGEAS